LILRAIHFIRSTPAVIIYNKMSNKATVTQDIIRNYGTTDKTYNYMLRKLLRRNAAFRNLFYNRVSHYNRSYSKILKIFYKPMKQIEIDSEIGGGFIIYHGYSTIVFANRIGENCSVYQQVTIGRGKKINGIDIPTIGDNVDIFAGAKVIGGIHVGNNCKIGAGAVVTKDIPDNCTVVGNPGKIVKMNGKKID